jgi:hypothetical protein
MIDVEITFFNISPEIEFDNRRGHLVRYAYRPAVDDDLVGTEFCRYFNFLENVVFKLEWRRYINNNFVLLKSREQSVFPSEHFQLKVGLIRSGQCFLDQTFLTSQTGFLEAPELFCRISLTPVLAAKRRAIGYDRHGAYYKLIPEQAGSPNEFDSGMPGYQF